LTTGGIARQAGEPWSEDEVRLLESVELYLSRGRELLAWWNDVYPRDAFARRFELGRSFNDADISFGFFDEVTVGGQPMPAMGNFQEMFYDQPKTPSGQPAESSAAWMREQMRQYALRYFMRVSDFRAPEGFAEVWQPPTSGLFEPLSWCPKPDSGLRGFGFQQLFFKRTDGEIGRFPQEERFSIVDVRELGQTYEWIVVKVCIFDFKFTVAPFGSALPQVVVPLAEDSYLVLSRDFIVDQEQPAPDLLGRYGIGYSFIKNPRPSALGYGPGEFEAAIETIQFEVYADGTVHVPMVFVANRPDRIINLRFDPVGWGFKLADWMTLGLARPFLAPLRSALASRPTSAGELDPVFAYIDFANAVSGGLSSETLCISREQLDRDFLLQHFMQHYQTVAGSLATWRQIPDWLAEAELPEWVVKGRDF
jgi:hypothetical protein